jgi:hypothetical protein
VIWVTEIARSNAIDRIRCGHPVSFIDVPGRVDRARVTEPDLNRFVRRGRTIPRIVGCASDDEEGDQGKGKGSHATVRAEGLR